jgi:hypothetical protein
MTDKQQFSLAFSTISGGQKASGAHRCQAKENNRNQKTGVSEASL